MLERVTQIPDGYATVAEIAKLAEIRLDTAIYRLKTAGVPMKCVTISGTTGRKRICPQREALYAVLKE